MGARVVSYYARVGDGLETSHRTIEAAVKAVCWRLTTRAKIAHRSGADVPTDPGEVLDATGAVVRRYLVDERGVPRRVGGPGRRWAPEHGGRLKVLLTLPPELVDALDRTVEDEGIDRSALVERIVRAIYGL